MNSIYLKSFTVLEALISLILMGIIIALSYSVFNLIEKQMILFQKENTSVLQYNLFNTAVKNDIYNATSFSHYNNQLSLEYYDGTSINYTILKKFILRQNDIKTDTFKLRIINYEFLQSDISIPLNKTLQATIEVLEDSITTNYYLRKNRANTINNIFFNEN